MLQEAARNTSSSSLPLLLYYMYLHFSANPLVKRFNPDLAFGTERNTVDAWRSLVYL